MTTPALPPEIFEEHIIDNLAHDHRSLAACALVCKAWTNASQKRIFFHVEIDSLNTVSGEVICNKLNSLLTRSPHIALYISEIFLADGMQSRRWMTRSRQTLSAVLSKLVNITKVDIALATPPWNEASALRDVFRGLFRQPKIRKIVLRGLSYLPSWDELFYMLNGSHADHVLLYAVTLDPAASKRASRRRRGQAIQRPRSTIGCLETNSSVEDLEDFGFWADNPKSCLDISSLPKFSYDVMRVEDISGCNAVLQAEAFRSLESFEIVVEGFREVVTTQLDLSRVRHVQLTVREIPYNWADFGNVLRWYAHVFETSRSASVEEVTLTCAQWAGVNDSFQDQLDRWRSLDLALARAIPSVRIVRLKTESEFPVDVVQGKAFLQEYVGQMFPVLLERGILHQVYI